MTDQATRVQRWRAAVVAGALATSLGVATLIGVSIDDGASATTDTSVVSTTSTTTTTTDTGTSSGGVSSGDTSSRAQATTSGS